MKKRLKELAVEQVKPRVSEQTWKFLRKPNAQTWRGRTTRVSLTELAQQFGTDKWGLHRYTPHYEHHLQHLRDQRFTMLEIGIGGYAKSKAGGASLRMWKAFFPKAQIIGLDIEDKSFVDQSRIRTYQGSQVDPVILDKILTDAGEVQVDHRRRQPPARAHPRDLRLPVPQARPRRHLRHRGHQHLLLARLGRQHRR